MFKFRSRSLTSNKIKVLGADSFKYSRNILSIDLRGNPIKEIHDFTFQNLSRLKKL